MRGLRPVDAAGLLALGAIWGGSFVLIRVAVPALGPGPLVELRVILGAVGLCAVALATRRALGLWRDRWRFLFLGTISIVAPFLLISWAELRLSAGLAAILNSTTPLFTALVVAAWLRHWIRPLQGLGLALGMVGVAVISWRGAGTVSAATLTAAAAILLASTCYAVGAVYASRAFPGRPPLTLALGELLVAAAVVSPVALAGAGTAVWTLPALGAAGLLGVLSTAVAYLLYFRLLARIGPTAAMTVTFLAPLFALIWGALLLQERVTWVLLAGLAIILVSVLFVSGQPAPTVRAVAGDTGP